MAFERKKEIELRGDSLDIFVDKTMKMYSQQLAIRNANEETEFNRRVLEENMGLDDQLKFREMQLKRVADDRAESKRIKGEVSYLKDRIEQKIFVDGYLDELIGLESGMGSADSIIDWLNNYRVTSADETIKLTISQKLVEMNQRKFALTQKLIVNQTEFAIKDRSESIINDQIARIQTFRNDALNAGTRELVSVYDLQIQSLEKAKQEIAIENDLRNFAVATMTNASSAAALLDQFNNKIAQASTYGNITVGDTTYTSAREFWTYKRDTYLADTSATGFFTRFGKEKENYLTTKNSQNLLSEQEINTVVREYDTIFSRPGLVNYLPQMQTSKQSALQIGVNYLADKIFNQFNVSGDINEAFNKLMSLKSMGASVDAYYSKIITLGAKSNEPLVRDYSNAIMAGMAAGLTPEQSQAEAMKSGAGTFISPLQYATTPPQDIALQKVKGSQQGTYNPSLDTRNIITGPNTPEAPPIVPGAPPATTTPTPPIAINKQMDFGMTDAQVLELQKFLNKAGFAVATTGPGSVGQETSYYGPLTQAAVQKFQAAQGIVSSGDPKSTGYGRVGPQTLAAIKAYKY